MTTIVEPLLAEVLDEREDLRGLHDAERRGRLVEDEDARMRDERAGDRHRLPLAAGQRADLGPRAVERRHRERGQQLARAPLHGGLVQRAPGRPRPGSTSSEPR